MPTTDPTVNQPYPSPVQGLIGAVPGAAQNIAPQSVGVPGMVGPTGPGSVSQTTGTGITSPFTVPGFPAIPPIAIPPRIPGFTPPPNVAPMAALPNVAPLSETDLAAKQAADYGQAKENVGLETRGALTGLAGAMAGRGIIGSGVEGRGQVNVVNQGQQQLGAVNAAQADELAKMQEDVASQNFSGNITQRGQTNTRDIAGFQGDINQRGQTIGAEEANYTGQIGQRDTDVNSLTSQRGQDVTSQGQRIGAFTNITDALLGLVGKGIGGVAGGAAGEYGGGGSSQQGGGPGGGGGAPSIQDFINAGQSPAEALNSYNAARAGAASQASAQDNMQRGRYINDRNFVPPGEAFAQNAVTGLLGSIGNGVPQWNQSKNQYGGNQSNFY